MNDRDLQTYLRTEWPNETEFSSPIARSPIEGNVIVLQRNGHRLHAPEREAA